MKYRFQGLIGVVRVYSGGLFLGIVEVMPTTQKRFRYRVASEEGLLYYFASMEDAGEVLLKGSGKDQGTFVNGDEWEPK